MPEAMMGGSTKNQRSIKKGTSQNDSKKACLKGGFLVVYKVKRKEKVFLEDVRQLQITSVVREQEVKGLGEYLNMTTV